MRLASLVSHIPAARLSAEDIIRAAGGSPAEARVFERMFGLDHVAAVPEGETLSQQFDQVLQKLTASHTGPRPDALIYVHGQPLQYAAGQSPVQVLCANQPVLAEITRLLDNALQARSRYMRLADRASRLYAPAVHALAALAFIGSASAMVAQTSEYMSCES